MQKRYFVKGMQVTCLLKGHGVVERIDEANIYPVIVKFSENERNHYTFDGRIYRHNHPTLHQGHIEIVPPKLKEVFEFQKGQPVWVKLRSNGEWHLRYFSHFDENYFFCFSDQKKGGQVTAWPFCIPFENTLPPE